jgi:hypothetical protein
MHFLGRGSLPLLAAALFVLAFAGTASGALQEESLPQGRLGYQWVPEPPSRPLTEAEELGVQVAKYGGGGLVGLWLLRKMFSTE